MIGYLHKGNWDRQLWYIAIALLTVGCHSADDDLGLLGDLENPKTLQILPVGWSAFGGGGPDNLAPLCVSGVDGEQSSDAQVVMVVRCEADQASYGGLWRSLDLAEYRGKRARLSAEIKADAIESLQGAEGVGALWLRAETPFGPIVGNMRDRGVRDSTDWEYREGVVQVPRDARALMIGFWMQGRGQLFVRNVRFEVVSDDIAADFTPPPGIESTSLFNRFPETQ